MAHPAPADTTDHDDVDDAAVSESCDEASTSENVNSCIAPPDVPPSLLAVDATWIAVAWAPSTWAVVSDVPLGQRYRVLVANLNSPLDARMHDLHAYHCCYEGIGTSTQVRRGDRRGTQRLSQQAQVVGLHPGQLYALRVSAALVSLYNPMHVFDERLSPPVLATTASGAPHGLRPPVIGARSRNSLHVRWKHPASDGGHAQLTYMLDIRPAPAEFDGVPDAEVCGFEIVIKMR